MHKWLRQAPLFPFLAVLFLVSLQTPTGLAAVRSGDVTNKHTVCEDHFVPPDLEEIKHEIGWLAKELEKDQREVRNLENGKPAAQWVRDEFRRALPNAKLDSENLGYHLHLMQSFARERASKLIAQALQVDSDPGHAWLRSFAFDPGSPISTEAADALLIAPHQPEAMRFHPLYRGQLKDERFLDEAAPLRAVEFPKTGSRTVLLSGKLAGKVILKGLEEENLAQWRKAFESKDAWQRAGFQHNPVEPLLTIDEVSRQYSLSEAERQVLLGVEAEIRNTDYEPSKHLSAEDKSTIAALQRIRDSIGIEGLLGPVGIRRLVPAVAAVIQGPTVAAFEKLSASDALKTEAVNQVNRIIEVLRELGIDHGHLHKNNFCIVFVDGKPQVYVIDFDKAKAELATTKSQGSSR